MVKKALIFTTKQGHETLSTAITEKLIKNKWTVHEVKYENKSRIHQWLHRHSFWLMRLVAKPLMSPLLIPIEKVILRHAYLDYINQNVNDFKPDVVISTSYLLNPSIEYWRKKSKFVFINIITDPKTFLPLNPAMHADMNFVFDKNQEHNLKNLHPKIKTTTIGWLTKSCFSTTITKIEMRKKLGIDTLLPTILITSGSLGNQFSSNIIMFLLVHKIPCQVLFVAGSNISLKKRVSVITKLFSKSKTKVHVFGFVDTINELMIASDLVVGKAGPNTIFESVMSLRPFLATNYGGHQEIGNFEIIKDHNLGYTAQNIVVVIKILNMILNNPKEVEKFNNSLITMKRYLLSSESKFLKTTNLLFDQCKKSS